MAKSLVLLLIVAVFGQSQQVFAEGSQAAAQNQQMDLSLPEWLQTFTPSEASIELSNIWMERSQHYDFNSCNDVYNAYEELRRLKREFARAESIVKMALYGPMKDSFEAGEGPCKRSWYNGGNPYAVTTGLAGYIFNNEEITEKNMCMQQWRNYLQLWSTIHGDIKINEAAAKVMSCPQLAGVKHLDRKIQTLSDVSVRGGTTKLQFDTLCTQAYLTSQQIIHEDMVELQKEGAHYENVLELLGVMSQICGDWAHQ